MLSGPTNDYFSDTHHLRSGFTPNESGLRTGLTPGGSGSMFPAASPNSTALFAQLASGGATPNTLDFHRTALSAAAKREQSNGGQPHAPAQQPATSQPQEMTNGAALMNGGDVKPASGPFDPHDNDAANGLFMLAQGRNGAPETNSFTAAPGGAPHAHPVPAPHHQSNTSPQMVSINGGSVGSVRGISEASHRSDESEQARPNTRGKGKRSQPATNGRRKAEDAPAKAPPAKKAKTNGASSVHMNMNMNMNMNDMDGMEPEDFDNSDDDGMKDEGGSKSKMTDEEKRKNFLERNRVAALKCRQRKKQWLANLQTKVEMFSSENDALTAQITQLREEVVNLKTLLLAHKDCPVTQQHGMNGAFMAQVVEPYNSQMNPYGMAGPMQGQAVMAGQGVQRRFS
jgi:ATF/CREB family transcription factor